VLLISVIQTNQTTRTTGARGSLGRVENEQLDRPIQISYFLIYHPFPHPTSYKTYSLVHKGLVI
jgi:hypothetical protein